MNAKPCGRTCELTLQIEQAGRSKLAASRRELSDDDVYSIGEEYSETRHLPRDGVDTYAFEVLEEGRYMFGMRPEGFRGYLRLLRDGELITEDDGRWSVPGPRIVKRLHPGYYVLEFSASGGGGGWPFSVYYKGVRLKRSPHEAGRQNTWFDFRREPPC